MVLGGFQLFNRANTLARHRYVDGTAVVNTQLLNSITIAYNGSTVKRYGLTYELSPTTGRDELIQVVECADSAQSNCLFPTTISYQHGVAGVSTSASTLSMGSVANWYSGHYDFNGDGYKDLIYQNSSTGTWYVAFGSSTGFGAAVNTGITTAAYSTGHGTVLFGDLLGTGADGILANNGGTWYDYTWNGSSFSGASAGLTYDTTAAAFALADTNGDGLPDLVSLNESSGTAIVYIRPNSSSGGAVSFGAANTAFTAPQSPGAVVSNGSFTTQDSQAGGALRFLDFNGDGRQDLILGVQYDDAVDNIHFKNWWWLMGNGTSFATYQVSAPPGFFLNFNNDGCTDYVSGSTLFIASCSGTAATSINLGYSPLGAMDWDGDGRTDLIYNSGTGYLGVQLSTGQGLAAGTTTSIPYSSSALSYLGLDENGDGLDDLLVWQNDRVTLNYYPHNGIAQRPDLMSSATDGYGNFAKPTYVPLPRAVNVLYFESNDAQFPYQNYHGPLYLTYQAVFSDPSSASGGTYSQTYNYSGFWLNRQGRGLSPAGSMATNDSRNGVRDTVGYQRAFPYTGLFQAENKTSNNAVSGIFLSTSTTPAATVVSNLPNQQVYFPYISSQTTQNSELGSPSTRLVSTISMGYSFDNFGNATTITKTVTDNDTGSAYDGQSWTTTIINTPDPSPSTGCLNLFTGTQVAYTASSGASVTRTKQFTPDLTNCRYTQVITEPSSSTYKVTEALGYDSFGNVSSGHGHWNGRSHDLAHVVRWYLYHRPVSTEHHRCFGCQDSVRLQLQLRRAEWHDGSERSADKLALRRRIRSQDTGESGRRHLYPVEL